MVLDVLVALQLPHRFVDSLREEAECTILNVSFGLVHPFVVVAAIIIFCLQLLLLLLQLLLLLLQLLSVLGLGLVLMLMLLCFNL